MHPLIFFGSDQYSTIVLTKLILDPKSKIISIITDRPKPVGKEQNIEPTPVEKLAKQHNLKVSYYPTFDRSLITKDTLGLCASFDHLIPPDLIKLFGDNLYNLHPSLLPQYRNVSPVQYAIVLGEKATGITLFRISEGIDNGKIIAQATEPILPTDTTPTLTSRLFEKGAELFIQNSTFYNYTGVLENRITEKLIFTHRLTRESGFVEWPVIQKLLTNKPVTFPETNNELLRLRLGSDLKGSAQPTDSTMGRSDPVGILSDLLRALSPWPGVWSNVPTKKGNLRISFVIKGDPHGIQILIAGKPKPITYSDFEKYYLKI